MSVTIASLSSLSSTVPKVIERNKSEPSSSSGAVSKKDIKSFNDVLNHFPMIARQLQPGLERVFREFNRDIGKTLPTTEPRTPTSLRSRTSSMSSSTDVNGSAIVASKRRAKNASITSNSIHADEEENQIRQGLETTVNASIDLFQLVDKQQLSLLGANTDLTGPAVERLIEKYVAEHLHLSVLFPRLRAIHHKDDHDLAHRINCMSSLDIAQVGIEIDDGRIGKRRLIARLTLAIEEFRKLSTSSGPQEMLTILLETQKILSGSSTAFATFSEKSSSPMNADSLVSLLLLVVIRSQVFHLQTRLAYMRNFIFIDDVESGELGYALSTFEAVLQYISTDSGGLRMASRRNKRLWLATRKGSLSEMRTILEPDNDSLSDEADSLLGDDTSYEDTKPLVLPNGYNADHPPTENMLNRDGEAESDIAFNKSRTLNANLDHVFPFQAIEHNDTKLQKPKSVKRVSMDLQSISGTSEYSFRSRTDTLNSKTSVIEGDTSIETLCQSEDESGNSILMMAVEGQQPDTLDYLLSLGSLFPDQLVLDDTNHDDTTLLSAAVQTANADIIEVLASHIRLPTGQDGLKLYLAKADKTGRTVAHYLFHAPHLISLYGTLLPWRQKDKNGQTPLLALCRSYDHPHYLEMVNEALRFAVDEQGDGQALHMDYHVDNKGNTLLHAVTESYLALRILQQCDADPNSPNHKQFTPLMMASKYGRVELVRTFFLDPRIDLQIKEYRGMTAVELAKDDEVRNRIDDLVLVSNPSMPDGRVVSIVRSFFVEDGSIRLIIKTATQSGDGLAAVTTCRRSLTDFENLVRWLAVEQPVSWLPSNFNFRSPFQIPSKPSRAVLYDIQVRLNKFLQIMLGHPSFGSHEALWEFILMPEIQPHMMAERSLKKSELRREKIREETSPIQDVQDVEIFVTHARESIRGVHQVARNLLRRVNNIRNLSRDLYTSMDLALGRITSLEDLPYRHATAIGRYVRANQPPASDPFSTFQISLLNMNSTIVSVLSALSRPHTLINTLSTAHKTLERHNSMIKRTKSGRITERSVWSSALPIGALMEENRQSQAQEAQDKLEKRQEEVYFAACELNDTYQIVAGELAGWQDQHEQLMKQAIRGFARTMVIKEKSRLEGMNQALRIARQEINAYPETFKQRGIFRS